MPGFLIVLHLHNVLGLFLKIIGGTAVLKNQNIKQKSIDILLYWIKKLEDFFIIQERKNCMIAITIFLQCMRFAFILHKTGSFAQWSFDTEAWRVSYRLKNNIRSQPDNLLF